MTNAQTFNYFEESQAQRFARKARESPFMILGIVGFVGVCAIGAYKYKHRGNMSTSVYLMHLRMAAQGTVIGLITLGMTYDIIKKRLL